MAGEGPMKKKALWVVICFVAGGVVWPASYVALWAMRSNFLGEYTELKKDCERVSGRAIEPALEGSPETALVAEPSMAGIDYCSDLFQGLRAYREAIFNRSLGFGIVVFLGLLIVRFVMFPPDDAPGWIEHA
jgi:hypothetical protein